MPNPRPLDELRRRLAQALSLPLPLQVPKGWSHEAAMVAARQRVQETFNGLSAPPGEDTILSAVQRFASNPEAVGFTQIKHLCYGLNLPTADGAPQLIQSPSLFGRLMDQVDAERREPRRFRRCYQALLQSYFVYDRPLETSGPRDDVEAAGDREFETLRVYLKDQLWLVAKPIGRQPAPAWTIALTQHENLLSTTPCDRYVDELNLGQTHSLQEVCAALGINRQSWVWQEVILAYLRALCAQPDQEFQMHMGSALDIADTRTELRPSAAVSRQVVARVVARYEGCQPHPEHPRLRDLAVQHIGNPWIKQPAWDTFVGHEPARKMVDGWLKSRLIRDFFELLSHDGKAEQQRLDYWLRFEPVIEDMWFVLGASARRNSTPEFKELRKRMEGRRRDLSGTTSDDNNAFVMRIGNLLLVEFGVTGNACFVHDWYGMQQDLELDALHIDLVLKRRDHLLRLTHARGWQSKFDAELCGRIGFWPEGHRARASSELPPSPPTRPPQQPRWPAEPRQQPPLPRATGDVLSTSKRRPLIDPAEQARWLSHVLSVGPTRGFVIDDKRPKGGALWVLTPEPVSTGLFKTALDRAGFSFKAGKGYWLET